MGRVCAFDDAAAQEQDPDSEIIEVSKSSGHVESSFRRCRRYSSR